MPYFYPIQAYYNDFTSDPYKGITPIYTDIFYRLFYSKPTYFLKTAKHMPDLTSWIKVAYTG